LGRKGRTGREEFEVTRKEKIRINNDKKRTSRARARSGPGRGGTSRGFKGLIFGMAKKGKARGKIRPGKRALEPGR